MKPATSASIPFSCVLLILILGALTGTTASAQTIYVWSYGKPDQSGEDQGYIQEFTSPGSGTLLASTGSSYNGPVGLAVDSYGFLYSGNPSNSTVTQYAAGGVSTALFQSDSISGLAFYNGQLYGTSPNYDAIVDGPKLNSILADSPATGEKVSYPLNIAFNSQGDIFAANFGNPYDTSSSAYANTIEEFSPIGADLKTFASNLNEPYGLAFDALGNLYVSDLATNSIDWFSTNGIKHFFASSVQGLNKPAGLAFDSAGNLYVTNEGNGTVEEFYAQGGNAIIAAGLSYPVSIAISDLPLAAAPEPASWSLGALAAVAFGVALSRASRAARRRSPC